MVLSKAGCFCSPQPGGSLHPLGSAAVSPGPGKHAGAQPWRHAERGAQPLTPLPLLGAESRAWTPLWVFSPLFHGVTGTEAETQ